MTLAAFEPGQEMAIANFSLAIFCLFTIALPLLLITRGDKTKANRDFIAATFNPWSQIFKDNVLTPVVISGVTPTIEVQPELEIISEHNDQSISESKGVISIYANGSEEPEVSSAVTLETNDEILAA